MESHPAGQGRRGACHGMPKAPTGRPRRLVAGLGCAGLVVGLHLMRRRGGAGRNRRGRAYAAACDYAVPDAAVDDEVAVFVTSVAARVRALPVMLDSLMRGSLLPAAVYVVVPGDGDVRCPRPGGRTALRRLDAPAHPHVRLTVYFVRALEDRGPVEKYLGALGALPAAAPRFALVVDDDHEYDPDLVRKYSAALHRDPGVAFTVQSPARELDFEPWFPIVFGSRGVGVALATLRTGLVDFYRDAIAFEPTCRLVDDVVISAYLAANDVDVRDVPGFSFAHRPWTNARFIHKESKKSPSPPQRPTLFGGRSAPVDSPFSGTERLRGPLRTEQNQLCHDKLLERLLASDAAPRFERRRRPLSP